MLPASPPQNDERLRELYSFEVLDTDPEEPFDEIVKLASALCGMPVSLISLVDADRQWFKARTGTELTSTGMDSSICAHAILQKDDFLEIPDATADPRTADNPLVTGDPHLRFYAGAVLRTSAGQPIGSLCVIDHKPGHLTPLQRDTLRVLAQQVITRLELQRSLKHSDLLRREVDHRVKNSLQSVSALIRMQARDADSPEAREALEQVRRRIETVAALHEQLYRSADSESIALKSFGDSVSRLIADTAPPHIFFTSDWPDAQVDPDVAAAIGVILNEFASNSFKHAFPDQRAGQVSVLIGPEDAGRRSLTLCDDGVGIPPLQPGERQGLGMQVIEASARQLGGAYDLQSTATGTRIRLDFPLRQARSDALLEAGALARM